ncbi:MAG TPA: hypothetical protein PK325_07820 [Cyclobacteriaceae bacterium]|jgi:hypothetical protein|nr:hypothetical protein [Cyclobacteriaceae bacterium]HMV10569.1 hypothetical protein [Cyclobacteriaceae bacterium]HMV88541.1 hypothetical protein [Cyclobacteriaceae bacterium]HMW99419.1 hypothetical protein [Cyclobacteriaceae bacterium]HMX48792.1 hypothetical protein [Cyclobacteriaceae bacterium]
MEREREKSDELAAKERGLLFLENMDKTAVIKKYLDLEADLKNARNEIEILRKLLIKSSDEYKLLKATNPHIDQADYNKSWGWVNKIVFVLKKINRPLRSSEIINFITPYEPVLQHSHYRAQAFSANLNKAVKYDRVKAYKLSGSRGYYYVLPTWLDINGQLAKEYEDKIFFK